MVPKNKRVTKAYNLPCRANKFGENIRDDRGSHKLRNGDLLRSIEIIGLGNSREA